MFRRLLSTVVCIAFFLNSLSFASAQDFSVNQLPLPGTMVDVSTPFAPLALKGLIVDPQKPLEFQFIVDTGKGPQDAQSVKDQAGQLVKYFLAGLTIPEGDLWVNLSPYEKDRIIPTALGQTYLGRDLLAQDYVLKQLTASLIYPEKDLGREFWNKVYAQAQKQFGTTDVPVNTFNKVWILPDQVQIYQHHNTVYITKATLKVMLDEDYLSLKKHVAESANSSHALGSQIVRAIILPAITREVNQGRNFASLRQIYQALILAKWYKGSIQNRLLEAVYTDKSKIAGVDLADPTVKEQIYARYIQAYKKGVFNYIKDTPVPNGKSAPRKYFSGGVQLKLPRFDDHAMLSDIHFFGTTLIITISLAVTVVTLMTAGVFASKYRFKRNENNTIRMLNKSKSPIFRAYLLTEAYYNESSLIIGLVQDRELTHLERKLGLIYMLQDLKSIFKLKPAQRQEYFNFWEETAVNPYKDISILAKQGLGYAVEKGKLNVDDIPEQIREDVIAYSHQDASFLRSVGDAKYYTSRFIFVSVKDRKSGDPTLVNFLLEQFDRKEIYPLIQEYLFDLAYEVFLSQGPNDAIKAKIRVWLQGLKEQHLIDAAKRALSVNSKLEGKPAAPAAAAKSGAPSTTTVNFGARLVPEMRPAITFVLGPGTTDKASLAQGQDPGGIDLNQIDIHASGNKIDVKYDPVQLNDIIQGGFEGFQSVIIKVSTVPDPLALFS